MRSLFLAVFATVAFTGCQVLPATFTPPAETPFKAPQAPGPDPGTILNDSPTGGKVFEAPQAPCGCEPRP